MSITALAALAALRRAADPDDVTGDRALARPVDRIDAVREARRLAAEGATVGDIASALGISSVEVRAITGPQRK